MDGFRTIVRMAVATRHRDPARGVPARADTGRRESHPPQIAWTFAAVYVLVAVAVAAGLAGPAVSGPVLAGATVAVAVGARLNRPRLSWPFWGFVVAGVFWMFAATARELTGSTGNLTGTRSMIPDVLGLPGYFAYAAGLAAMIRARDGGNRGALLDAVVVSVGGFLLSWQFLVSPALETVAVAPQAQLSIAMYPVLDCLIVALATRLAFTTSKRLAVHGLLLVAMCGMLVGDITYVFEELDVVDVGGRRDIGYLLAAAAMGAAALHPSVREVHLRGHVRRRALPTARASLLAVSLLLPAGLFIFGIDDASVRALPFQFGVVALAVLATFRLLDSVRTQNLAADTLAWRADHDPLTRLPNRNAIARHLDERVKERRDLVVAYFDLDHFKNINDALGHVFGDELLVRVSARLREALPDEVILARVGGDEFVAVCDTGRCNPDALANRIHAALSEPFRIGGFETAAPASIGLTIASGERDADAILRDADTAMYRAKDSGRGTHIVFSDDMRTEVERRIRCERELREALDRGGDIRAYFQPIIDITTDRVIGFEALARWVTPTGLVPPNEFIQVAEDTGLIGRLGAEILDQACRTVADIRRRTGRDLFVTVNLSARQLTDDGIVPVVADVLERHRLPGAALCLEITESIMVNDANVDRLRALRRLGVWLAVDDFGTGYSSLSYLRRMPVSKVKIDKSFVDDIASGDPSIMVAILSMAHSLGLTCVAEGVETDDQAARLRSLGCDAAQGYLWARPVPADQLMDQIDEQIVVG